jgi:hypothetical protein
MPIAGTDGNDETPTTKLGQAGSEVSLVILLLNLLQQGWNGNNGKAETLHRIIMRILSYWNFANLPRSCDV